MRHGNIDHMNLGVFNLILWRQAPAHFIFSSITPEQSKATTQTHHPKFSLSNIRQTLDMFDIVIKVAVVNYYYSIPLVLWKILRRVR
jgi:hypothetical protein